MFDGVTQLLLDPLVTIGLGHQLERSGKDTAVSLEGLDNASIDVRKMLWQVCVGEVGQPVVENC